MSSGSTRGGGGGGVAPGPALMPMRSSMSCVSSSVTGVSKAMSRAREPHLLVAGLVLEAGLVAGVGLEQAAVEVGDRGAVDVLVEEAAQVGHRAVPDHRAEALDRADAGERRDDRLGHAVAIRNFDCSTFGKFSGQVSSGMSSIGVPNCRACCLPRLDRGHAVQRAGRHVGAVVVEPAVAAHAAGDQRLGEVVVSSSSASVYSSWSVPPWSVMVRTVNSCVYTWQQVLRASCSLVSERQAASSGARPRPSPRPASPAPRWTTWPTRPASPG